MPRININEYDSTFGGTKTYNDNIVAIPINAADGPSDRWVTVYNYDDFIQLFGANPSIDSNFGNSWEYAANLLLRGMPVCVRRITHELLEDGSNSRQLLPNVNIAKTILKIKNSITDEDVSYNFKAETINVSDSAYHSVLKSSSMGEEELDNIRLKKPSITVDGVKIEGQYPNALALNQDTDLSSTSFLQPAVLEGTRAYVTSTNSEWRFTGYSYNEHFKGAVDMSQILSMDQTTDEYGNSYKIGDFFVNESGHIVKFVENEFKNKYLCAQNVEYPDDLRNKYDTLSYNPNAEIYERYFAFVKYDANNTKTVNKVWVYVSNSDEYTEVLNHKFINGTIKVENVTDYKAFKSKNELPIDNTVQSDSFAVVKVNTGLAIFGYTNGEWKQQSTNLDILTDSNSDYCLKFKIPFKITEYNHNTDIYKTYFNWVNTGEASHHDENYPEILYAEHVYWENTHDAIGTTPEKIKSNNNIKINTIKINTNSNMDNSKISFEINGNRTIKSIEDYSDTKLSSGIFELTNTSDDSIRIYELSITNADQNLISYDSGLQNIINENNTIKYDALLQYRDKQNKILSHPVPKLDKFDTSINKNKWYIELEPGCTLQYNSSITNGSLYFNIAGFKEYSIKCSVYKSSQGCYEVTFKGSTDNANDSSKIVNVLKNYIPKISKDEPIDYDDIPINDNSNNINMFVAEYLYPGSNGNHLRVCIKHVFAQGIYMYVYRQQQFLEKIELCSFRYPENGIIKTLDTEINKIDIWRSILLKFGVIITDEYDYAIDVNKNRITENTNLNFIFGKYIKVSINKNIILNNPKSLQFINSLYLQNGSDDFNLQNGKNPDDDHVIHEVHKCYVPLLDKYRYDIKFVTNGSYIDKKSYSQSYSENGGINSKVRLIEDAMLNIVSNRKDCVAFFDVPYDLPLEDVPFYFAHISSSYAAAYDPWGYIRLSTGATKWMPPSFIQLYTHAKSIQSGNKLYLPPAGVRRAQVPEILETNHSLTSEYLTMWQDETTPQFINPIIWINGYDYTIYGQKTLYNIVNMSDKYQSALQDLNVRLVANEIKKLIFKTCIELTFELNNILTWNEFKSKIEPMLSVMQGEGVLTDYNIVMGTETMTVADLNSGHIVGTIRISIARAVTDWDINFELTPNSVTFNEYDYNSMYNG